MKFTPEQLVAFAQAGWSPEAIKEMCDYDVEVKEKAETGEPVTPDDVANHSGDPTPKKEEEKKPSADDLLDNMIGG